MDSPLLPPFLLEAGATLPINADLDELMNNKIVLARYAKLQRVAVLVRRRLLLLFEIVAIKRWKAGIGASCD